MMPETIADKHGVGIWVREKRVHHPERAPPIREHADGEHTSEVMTVTRPLLERFAGEDERIGRSWGGRR